MRRIALIVSFCSHAFAATAVELPASALVTGSSEQNATSVSLPRAPFADGSVETLEAEGNVTLTAWRIATRSLTTLQILSPIVSDLEGQGYEITFRCATEVCGGFDFRYSLPLLPEPAMHVDLGDFRYVLAEREDRVTAVIVSRAPAAGFIQEISVERAEYTSLDMPRTPEKDDDPLLVRSTPTVAMSGLESTLEKRGAAVLGDLDFPSGASALAQGEFASLRALADYLKADPTRRVVLVGHTDAVGSLDVNVALSRARAQSVLVRLVDVLGVPSGQLSSDGVGFLAPITTNATPEGRAENRRVEAVIASTP